VRVTTPSLLKSPLTTRMGKRSKSDFSCDLGSAALEGKRVELGDAAWVVVCQVCKLAM
jgi:hypothetical protein